MARRNGFDLNLVLAAAIVAAGGYALSRIFGVGSRVAAAAGEALDTTSSKVADFAEKIFPHGNTTLDPRAAIMLSDSSVIPASAPSGVGSFTDTDGNQKIQFYYQGHTYRTDAAAPDSAGMYYATILS